MTITLTPLFTMVAELEDPILVGNTPAGLRLIYEVASGSIDGERIRGKLKGKAAADWLTVGPDGIGTVDVRALIETDDAALVCIQYLGRVDASQGPGQPIRIAPRFETSDPRYAWLNVVQAVGRGELVGSTLTYEVASID